MGVKFAKFVLKLIGWRGVEPDIPEKKCLFLGVPHTSIWDFPVSYFYCRSIGIKPRIMIKGDFFFWPLGPILKSLGAIPLYKDHKMGITKQIIDAVNSNDTFHLALAPEGTRAPVKRWKTGFHTIAKATGIPVYLGYFDWGKKEVGRGIRFELSDDPIADMKRVQEHYKKMGVVGKHPHDTVYMD